jgi:hypothetical protein
MTGGNFRFLMANSKKNPADFEDEEWPQKNVKSAKKIPPKIFAVSAFFRG